MEAGVGQQSEFLALVKKNADIGFTRCVDQGNVSICKHIHPIRRLAGPEEHIPTLVFLEEHQVRYLSKPLRRQLTQDLDIGQMIGQLLPWASRNEVNQLRKLLDAIAA